jgi:FkbM family methyltransferase
MDISPFVQCFDKHNFEELNNLDINMLFNAVLFYKNNFSNTNGVFFDIGSNSGSFVKVLQQFDISQNIHCFEPHPVLHEVTKLVYPFIHMNNYCLGNINGNIDIYIPQWSVGLSSIINRPVFSTLNQEINKINVQCKTLDTYCKENNIDMIDFVKIDVEGAEKFVLEGATELLQNKKIRCGIFEIGQTLYDANTNENQICTMLMNYGYTINTSISNSDYLFYLQ